MSVTVGCPQTFGYIGYFPRPGLTLGNWLGFCIALMDKRGRNFFLLNFVHAKKWKEI